MIGLDTSAVRGAPAGDPFVMLEVLEPVNDSTVEKAKTFLDEKEVVVNLREEQGLYIRCVLKGGEDTAESLITQLHSNIIELKYNDKVISDSPLLSSQHAGVGTNRYEELENWLKKQTLADLVSLIGNLDEEDLKFIKHGVQCNLKLAAYGLKHGTGLGIGKAVQNVGNLSTNGMLETDRTILKRMQQKQVSKSQKKQRPEKL